MATVSRPLSTHPTRRRFVRHLVAGAAGLSLTPQAVASAFDAQGTPASGPSVPSIFPFTPYARRYSIGEYIPKDQGGKFIQASVFGSEDDAEIVRAVRAGRLREVYGNPPGWSTFERTAIERSVWLNRFYFLPAFARQYFTTGDTSYLTDMMAWWRRWAEDNPLGPDSSRATYNWRDMQVAWRAIHLSWCYFLGYDGLSDDDRAVLVAALREHGGVLLDGFGRQPLSEFNHQSHGALAMLYLGTLFPTLPDAGDLTRQGLRILSHHVQHAFFPDGGNVEQMFGYYPFVAHVFRDTRLLCRAGGVAEPPGLESLLVRMADYLETVAQPDGTMPAVNDSYDMPVAPVLETLRDVIGRPAAPAPGPRHFEETGVAVLRSGDASAWYVLANPAASIGAHSHAGRLAFTLWHAGRPVLVDSGCCNYDDPRLVTWYRTSRAHNTVLIDGRSDEETSGPALWVARRSTANRITDWQTGPGHVACRMLSPAEEATNGSVTWNRCLVAVGEACVVIHDEFDASGSHRYDTLFHVAAGQTVQRLGAGTFIIGHGGGASKVGLFAARPELVRRSTVETAEVSVGGVGTPAPLLTLTIEGDGPVSSTFVVVPVAGDPAAIHVTRRDGPTGAEIVVQWDGADAVTVVIPPFGAVGDDQRQVHVRSTGRGLPR